MSKTGLLAKLKYGIRKPERQAPNYMDVPMQDTGLDVSDVKTAMHAGQKSVESYHALGTLPELSKFNTSLSFV